MTEAVPLGLLDRSVPIGSHMCAFYAGSADRDKIVLPFLAEGLRSGHKCIAVLDSVRPAEVLARLDNNGVDADAAAQTGQLELDDPAHAYFGSGPPCGEDMLGYWEHGIDAVQASGAFAFIKAMTEMPSGLDHPSGRTEFFRFEAMLNQLCPAFPQVMLCLRDLERTGAEVMMDTLRTHPVAIMDDVIHANPYYIGPDTFLARIGL